MQRLWEVLAGVGGGRCGLCEFRCSLLGCWCVSAVTVAVAVVVVVVVHVLLLVFLFVCVFVCRGLVVCGRGFVGVGPPKLKRS